MIFCCLRVLKSPEKVLNVDYVIRVGTMGISLTDRY